MAQNYVQSNLVGMRVYFDGKLVEDVTTYTPPTKKYKTTSISSAGMAGDVDYPNQTAIEAMEASLAHNNGVNCNLLSTPGVHNLEVRVVRQKYNVKQSKMQHERITWRDKVIHKDRTPGSMELNNPYGNTDKFSVVRHEEVINGKQTCLYDIPNGKLVDNGKSVTDEIENLLK